jgi:hypothetical protein
MPDRKKSAFMEDNSSTSKSKASSTTRTLLFFAFIWSKTTVLEPISLVFPRGLVPAIHEPHGWAVTH